MSYCHHVVPVDWNELSLVSIPYFRLMHLAVNPFEESWHWITLNLNFVNLLYKPMKSLNLRNIYEKLLLSFPFMQHQLTAQGG